MKRVEAPWNRSQVDSLNDYQWMNVEFPAYTCNAEHEDRVLVADTEGWSCPGCSYTQNWAWDYAASDAWRQSGVFW